jgi:hypothetical protein
MKVDESLIGIEIVDVSNPYGFEEEIIIRVFYPVNSSGDWENKKGDPCLMISRGLFKLKSFDDFMMQTKQLKSLLLENLESLYISNAEGLNES